MAKKTMSKIAAIALAGVTTFSTMGVVASADVKINQNIIDNTVELTGTATLMNWAITYKTTTHTASYVAETQALSYSSNTTLLATDATGTLIYDDINPAVTAVNRAGTYYATSANASAVNSQLTSAVSYSNKYGANKSGYGTEGLAAWKKSWTNYQHNERIIANLAPTATTCNLYATADATTTTPYTISGAVTNPIAAAPAATFTQETYNLTCQTNNNVTMADLKNNFGATVNINDVTGVITSGSKYTIIISGTASGNTGTSTGNYIYATPATTYRTSSAYVYFSNETSMWYPNLDALKSIEGAHGNWTSKIPDVGYSNTNCFFNPQKGLYEATSDYYSYRVNADTSVITIYKVNGYYYTSYSEALAAANNNSNLVYQQTSYSALPSNYFSNVTGSFYSTYAAALSASNGNASLVDVFNGASTDYYYGLYNDPYYYYWLSRNNGTSSSNKDTSSATLGKRSGWTSISKYLKSVSTGSTATVDMNNETVVPSSVLSAIKGRNVDVKFVLDNGATFTVNGKDVTTAKDVDIDTSYNTRSISSKLIKAAYKKNDAVSSAQLSIDAGTLGFTSEVTVKFNAKRGGYKAKLYRYNAAKNSLALVDTATVGSTGKCTFDKVSKGGEFVIVIYK